MSLSERLFDAVTRFPGWLESFDSLQIPGWGVVLTMAAAGVGLIFALREFLAWFLKTNSIVDEVVRLEEQVRDLQGDLARVESVVERLQSERGENAPVKSSTDFRDTDLSIEATQKEMPTESVGIKPQFRLDL